MLMWILFQMVCVVITQDSLIAVCVADGSTPLHHVCYTGSFEMLALLLSSGADGMILV